MNKPPTLAKFWDNILLMMNNAASILIFLMAILITADVIGRFAFDHPIPGTTEIIKCSLAAVIFLALAFTLQQERHVRATVLYQRMSRKMAESINAANSLCGSVIFLILAFNSWEAAWSGWLIREFEGVHLHVPVYPVRFVISIAGGMMAVQFLIRLVGSIRVLIGQALGEN